MEEDIKIDNIYNCCCLCLEEDKNNGDNLIWCNSMQLCENCYNQYIKNEYEQEIMPINAIKKYRRKLENLIARYKELEKHYQHEQEYINGEVFSAKQMHYIEDNYIDKSKVKEKIEEIKNTGIDVAWEQINYSIKEQDRAKIQVLQELLED